MTIDKHRKRAARQLSKAEGISYTAARRRLAADADQEIHDDSWAETVERVRNILTRHDVFCVGEAMQDAIDLGIDDDDQIREAAAQFLEERQSHCRCLTKPGAPDRLEGPSYRVPLEFQALPARYDSGSDFAQQLAEALGIYTALEVNWEPLHVDGTSISRVDDHTFIVSVTIPTQEGSMLVPVGHPAPANGEAAAELVVRRALLDLGFDHEAMVGRGGIRKAPTPEWDQ